MARPSKFPKSGAKLDSFLAHIRNGKTVSTAALLVGFSDRTARYHVQNDDKLRAKVEAAKSAHEDDLVNKVKQIMNQRKTPADVKIKGALKLLERRDRRENNKRVDTYRLALEKAQHTAIALNDFERAQKLAVMIEELD